MRDVPRGMLSQHTVTLSQKYETRRSRRRRWLRRSILVTCGVYGALTFLATHICARGRLSALTVQKNELLDLSHPRTPLVSEGSYAYATLVTSKDALPGAFLIGVQWRELNPKWERIVIILDGSVHRQDTDDLAKVFTRLLFTSYQFTDSDTKISFPYLTGWLAKFELLRLQEYSRILYADADISMFRDCKEMMNFEYAVQRTFGVFFVPSTLDGGTYVLTPDLNAWETFVETSHSIANNKRLKSFVYRSIGDADQGIVDFIAREGIINFTRLQPTFVQLKRIPALFPNLFMPRCGVHFSTRKPWEIWSHKDNKAFLPLVLHWRTEFTRACDLSHNIHMCERLGARFQQENRQILRATFFQWLLGMRPFNIKVENYKQGWIHELRKVELLHREAAGATLFDTETFANECELIVARNYTAYNYCVNEQSFVSPDRMCNREVGLVKLHFADIFPYRCTRVSSNGQILDLFTDSFLRYLARTNSVSDAEMRPCIYLMAKMCTSVNLKMENGKWLRKARLDLQHMRVRQQKK